MALNIPINLMSTGSPPAPSQSADGPTSAVQSASALTAAPTSGSGSAAANDNNSGQASSQQQAATLKRPTRAEPNSVLSAQTNEPAKGNSSAGAASPSVERAQDAVRAKALLDAVAVTPAEADGLMDRPKQVDRYAPPDPLPTAPILAQATPKAVKPATA
jgi:hypothetical protein